MPSPQKAQSTGNSMPPPKKKELEDSLAMPPPPNPPQLAILEPEMNALSRCLRNAVVQTGLIYEFHAKAQKSAPRHTQPPHSMKAALGREIEKYDQLCDSFEAHLLRAISVLQRDLTREEERIEKEKVEQKHQKVMETTSQETSEVTTSIPQPLKEDATLTNIQSSPLSQSNLPGRRPSAISISSLHRPAFPHKLDLSSTSFRMSAEDSAMFQSGLASPVTLAPKSARALGPNEFPPELIAAFANASDTNIRPPDIDLTLPDGMHDSRPNTGQSVDLTAGDSSDKPIELDLDLDIDMANMTDLFGDPTDGTDQVADHDINQNSDHLFSPGLSNEEGNNSKDNNFFSVEDDQSDSLFSSLAPNASGEQEIGSVTSPKDHISQQTGISAPSPGTLLASFPSPANQVGDLANEPGVGGTEQPFDFNSLDLSNLSPGFFSNGQGSDIAFSMDFSMAAVDDGKEANTSNSG